jgi:hypothetical protein
MSRSKSHVESVERRLAEAECVRLAEQFTDLLFDPKRPGARESFLTGLEQELRNPGQLTALTKKMRAKFQFPRLEFDRATIVKIRDAVKRRKRNGTLTFFTNEFRKDPPTEQHAKALLGMGDPQVWRKALLGAADKFKGKPGPAPRVTPSEYFELAKNADRLRPVLEQFLRIQGVSKHSTNQALEFLENDRGHGEACAFLQRHVQELDSALENQNLRKRGRRTASRAGVLADALAGADKKFSFRTSMEYVRLGRRQRGQKNI